MLLETRWWRGCAWTTRAHSAGVLPPEILHQQLGRDVLMPHVIIHRIFSLPVSLPVRGADGRAKRATYGGVERQRLSSQSVKAHLRAATGLTSPMADLAAAVGSDMSVRSALIGPRRIKAALKAL